jgi:hypothetical protein
MDTRVDGSDPITFAMLAHRFRKQGLTKENYRRTFRLSLSYEDITDPENASEIVGYRPLIDWFYHGRRSPSRSST